MNTNVYLLLILVLSLIIIAYLVSALIRVRIQLTLIKDALEDIKNGNLNRRILTDENDITKQICYDINEMAINSQSQLIQQKQSEQAYKQLMTSLSHDVKTPLASLVGYLEAVESKIVVGDEKDEYIHVASDKAHYLKNFVENLFEWVKLDSKEQVFHFDIFDLNELSRNIIADWIPVLESSHFEYEFDIPEIEYFLRIDANAYTRIINNLLQNIITHSRGDKMTLRIFENKEQAQIVITDNGKGISSDNLPHIFERLYQCDHSRAAKGNGLGLAIAKELINVHKGTVTANSTPGMGTEFTILLPKAL
ncbi:TPA: HAMP domain-containing histidine kinase [Clostridioides difficile]|nr:HAMP domain-containing histidine kinase [Clostridioides difficile]EGT4224263.1 HAMP domain-containing histidine kinase [Clostridioides difficile]HBG5055953.1 HAMP domain-containing histidine kinase [Clostridioides difficile]